MTPTVFIYVFVELVVFIGGWILAYGSITKKAIVSIDSIYLWFAFSVAVFTFFVEYPTSQYFDSSNWITTHFGSLLLFGFVFMSIVGIMYGARDLSKD